MYILVEPKMIVFGRTLNLTNLSNLCYNNIRTKFGQTWILQENNVTPKTTNENGNRKRAWKCTKLVYSSLVEGK